MPPKKSQRIALNKADQQQNNTKWVWKEQKTCIYGYSKLIGSQKVASFDMDSTLIQVKSGGQFPKDANDWIFWDKTVPEKLKSLENQGYKLVIYTNQKGISLGKSKASDIKKKIENIAKQAGVQMTAFIATEDDQYRKPNVKMWELHDQHLNLGKTVNKAISLFCGDAAGRKDAKHKDFSDTDLKFAVNLGVSFKLPQVLFLGEKQVQIQIKGFNPKSIPDKGELIVGKKDEVKFVDKEMVIFVGSPGSGKSTFWQNYLPKYVRVNRDTLKTKQKCYKVAEEQIKKGNSVVIDNTNPKKEDRKYFLQLAKKYNYKARCFYFLTSKDICFHNDYQRVVNDKRKHLSGKAGSIPIHGWFKNKQQPTIDEGFYEVNHVNFIAKFNDNDDKIAYQSFSKK